MKIQQAVKDETKKIALGTILLSALMLLVFLLIGKMDYTVILGAILGMLFAVGNFFLMALSVQKAAGKMNGVRLEPADEEEADDEKKKQISPEAKQAKMGMQLSYMLRMLLMVGMVVLALKVSCFNPYAAIIPLFFPRIVIAVIGVLMKRKEKES